MLIKASTFIFKIHWVSSSFGQPRNGKAIRGRKKIGA